MKAQMFVNAIFEDKAGDPQYVACRLRGQDAKTVRIPAENFETLPEKHDGLSVEISGTISESDNYVTCPDAKILDVVPGAGVSTSVEHDADDYFSSIESTEVEGDEEPF